MDDRQLPNLPRVVTTCAEAFDAVQAVKQTGKRIGLVPTMGALHAGHLSLVEAANAECDFTIATIFVNPTQFSPQEDFGKYPRTIDADLQMLQTKKCDLVFAPTKNEIYPAGFSTFVEPPQAARPLEGESRPGHFRGVATVVLKLFHIIPADVAYFGRKDFQQSLVIRRMVHDLNVPIQVRICPIIREPDGLALSSRNRYLSAAERAQAVAISRSLRLVTELFSSGERDAVQLVERMRSTLLAAGITQIEYVSLVDAETLAPVTLATPGTVALIAARVGTTRLIDNEILG